ncbi:hypothetical protein CSB45_07290 [candidate division KSB3 bacterium]|uniref:ZinT domain-containing protein n=1 Tax=candidate division KSB3 bacterium TaxID=2044937 RepID=A0A2G6E776_9BACT|nr:MAG: hypothetical protein CSB45_07290 [candidate division KSB3 bacterium]PIE29967.1 MAG: hypothetical protein CSA57_05305 [candidate division KSB3 bacterium]
MKTRKTFILSICTVHVLIFAAFAFAEDAELFAGWKGKWLSSHMLNSDPAMEKGFAAIAKAAEGKSAEDVKSFMASMYETDFGALLLEGNTITYYENDGTTVKAVCKYDSTGKESTTFTNKDGTTHEFYWYTFLLTSGGDACKEYTNLIMTEVHAHEEGKTHWHMRYGEMDSEKLMNHPNAMWWPTMVDADTTVENAVENTIKHAKDFASMF